MNLRRVGHLLTFELKRIKWLIVAAWFFLMLAIAPRISDGLGQAVKHGHYDDDPLAVLGIVGFGIVGLFLAIWAGLMTRGLLPARPVLKWELRVISWGVLLMTLVVPVLGLTFFSLCLYGFSGEVIVSGVGRTALAVVPLWTGVALFAKYAGSVRMAVVGLVVVGCLIALAESFGFRGMAGPWVNYFGGSTREYAWVASVVTVILLSVRWRAFRIRGIFARLLRAVICVALGWGAMLWVTTMRKAVTFEKELTAEAVIGERVWGFYGGSRRGMMSYQASDNWSGGVTVWEPLGSLVDEEGRAYQNLKPRIGPSPSREVSREGMKVIGMGMLEKGATYLDSWTYSSSIVARNRSNEQFFSIHFALPESYQAGEEVRLSGKLAGKRCEIDVLAEEVPVGEGVDFRADRLTGLMYWRGGQYEGDPEQLKVVAREFLSDGMPRSESNWLVLLKYPKAGVVVQGEVRSRGKDEAIGGVRRWQRIYEFHHSELRHFKIADETPLVSIYRVRVVECGHVEVHSDLLSFLENEGAGNSDYQAILGGAGHKSDVPPSGVWADRPDPEAATKAEVGAWFREVVGRNQYAAKVHDLSQFAEGRGALFLRAVPKSSIGDWALMRAFAAGASDDESRLMVEALEELAGDAGVVVERGWEEEAREKVALMIREGRREPELLRLGILLKLRGIEEAVLEGLLENDSWSLYEAARTSLLSDQEREGILDKRLALVEEATERRWAVTRQDYGFDPTPWLWLLHEGRRKDLEKCLGWMRKAHAQGNDDYFKADYQERKRFEFVLFDINEFKKLGEANRLQARFFDWDPVLRKWVFNEKGEQQ